MSRRSLSVLGLLPLAGMTLALAVVTSSAAWTDIEWITARADSDGTPLGTLDCTPDPDDDAVGTSTGEGRLLAGDLLGLDLDTLAELHGVTVSQGSGGIAVDPLTAAEVPGSSGTAFADPLDVTALGALNLSLGGVLALPLDTEAGVVGQYARAGNDLSSAGAAGAVTDSGGIDLETEDDPLIPGDERPRLATLELGTLLGSALGEPVADLVTGITDLRLGIGALASAAVLDACSAAWSGELYPNLQRDYAIAGLDLDLDSPLVAGLSGAVEDTLDGVEAAVAALGDDDTLVGELTSAVSGLVTGVLSGVLAGEPQLDLAVTVDLTAARALLDDTIGDDQGIVSIDLAAGSIEVDLEALFGSVYGSAGLNGLPPNTELLINAAVLAALDDAVTDALAAWVADVVDAVDAALGIARVTVGFDLPVGISLLGFDISVATITLDIDASLAALLDGTAIVDVDLATVDNSALCVIPVVGTALCAAVDTALDGLLDGLTPVVLTSIAASVGATVSGALAVLSTGLNPTLDAALDAPVALLLTAIDATLGYLFGEDDGVLSVLVNAQNDPDPADLDAGPEPTDWAAIPGLASGPPWQSGRYLVDALRITVLGATDPLEVALDLARSSVGSNDLPG